MCCVVLFSLSSWLYYGYTQFDNNDMKDFFAPIENEKVKPEMHKFVRKIEMHTLAPHFR